MEIKTNHDYVMVDMGIECIVNGETAGCAEEHTVQLNLTRTQSKTTHRMQIVEVADAKL